MSAMKAQIIEEKENPLMQRKEYWLTIKHEEGPTPSRSDVMKFLVGELKTKEDLLIVEKMFSEKGKTATRVRAEVYRKKEDIPKHKVDKSARRLAKTAPKPEAKEA
ncbi:MAG: 30S ribosomal protein S24e [Candidatus Aenigmatarchaeota archaeon]